MAIISDMNQPLGRAAGNAPEVQEAIDVLKGGGREDVRKLSVTLAGAMIAAGGIADEPEQTDMRKQTARDEGVRRNLQREWKSRRKCSPAARHWRNSENL